MDFSYSEEQIDVQNLARQILDDMASPEKQKKLEEAGERFDEKLWQQLGESGLLGIAIGEEYGGMGFDFETLALLVEEVGRTVAPVPAIPALVSAAMPIQRYGSDEQKQRLLPGLASGQSLLSAALVEPLNDDPCNPVCQVTFEGENCKVSGNKHAVPYADRAVRILAAGRAGDETVVFLLNPQADGVTLEKQLSTAREPWCHITMDNAIVDSSDILARGSEADTCLQWISEITTAANCMMVVGMTDKMMRMTASYTIEREQFGRPIATFQAVGQRAADCFIDVECLRVVSQEAVSLLNNAAADADATTETVMIAKIWCGDVTHRVSQASQHLHGGIGVDRDYALFRYCLWCKQVELTFGSSAAKLEQLGNRIAEQLLSA